jgi:hypothetical protein
VGHRDRGDGEIHVFDQDSARFQPRLLLSEDVSRRFSPREPLGEGSPAPILGAQQLPSPRPGAKPGDAKLNLRGYRRRHEEVPGAVLPDVPERDGLCLHQSGEGTGVKHQHF